MSKSHPWRWVPSLYLAEGLPYALVNLLSVAMYKDFGVSNAQITFYTAWLYLPWVIKPLWSPFVDVIRTKRWWVVAMQLLIGVGTAAVAFSLSAPFYFRLTIAIFWLMAFASSTHDIAADGFYMLALPEEEQSFFIGIRCTFYKVAQWLGNGALLILVGLMQHSLPKVYSWTVALLIMGGVFIALTLYHKYLLPRAAEQEPERKSARQILSSIGEVFATFFRKPGVWLTLAFILLYRLGEAMLVKMKTPFLQDAVSAGGLGLTLEQIGLVDGTLGMVCMIVGGIWGGIAISRKGLSHWLWVMLLCMALPNAAYIALAYSQTANIYLVAAAVGIEQLGYGFGFTSISMYMMYFAQGRYATSHFALATGFMALGMMLPGMAAGAIQEALGYPHFFVLVFVLSLVVMPVCPFLKIDPAYGRKSK